MLRRLLLGQPRRESIECKPERIDEKRDPDVLIKSTAKNLQDKIRTKDDISDSESETESSETEESDSESFENSSRNDSFEECFGDLLEWKGFEMVRDDVPKGTPGGPGVSKGKMADRKGQIASKKSRQSILGTKDATTGQSENQGQIQENPFANAFETSESEMSQIHDNTNGQIKDNDNANNNKTDNNNNNKAKNNPKSDHDSNTSNMNDNNAENENIANSNNDINVENLNNNKQTNQTIEINNESTSNNTNPTNVRKPKNTTKATFNNNHNSTFDQQEPMNNSIQQTNKRQGKIDDNQSKSKLQFPKSSITNHTLPKSNPNSISRHYSFRGDQRPVSNEGKTSDRKDGIPGKGHKIQPAQNLTQDRKRTSVDARRLQGIGNVTTRAKQNRNNGKGNQVNLNSKNVSVNDLERILGVNVAELREVIKKFKSEEKAGTTGNNSRQSDVVQGDLGSPGTTGDRMVDVSKNDKTQRKKEAIDNKDEISSDSGVSEPDAHSTDGPPRYISLKSIAKHKEYLESQIRELDDRMAVMKDHKKDIQFVHDLFDLHSDGLEKVERNNGGVPCVANLKIILACQLREMEEDDFNEKLKALEDLGIPHFSEINARIEKLRKRIRHALDDERKCRSKGVQKLRFEIGKVQGMCDAVLDCIYQE